MLMYFLFMYMGGLMAFCLYRKNFLLMLLSLEFIVLSLYMIMYVSIMVYGLEYYFMLIYLVVSVCEGVLGLSILVNLIRLYGSDYFYMFNLLW